MDVSTFCAQSHVLVMAGKGGVGKTTMSAAVARMASDVGKSVLIVELEGKSGINCRAFGRAGDLELRGRGAGRVVGRVLGVWGVRRVRGALAGVGGRSGPGA